MKPRESWLARSRTFHRNVPGVYCLKAFGVLDDDMNED